MRLIRFGLLTALLWTASALPAHADIIDFGVDISSTGATTQIADGFWGDNSGYTLANSCVLVLCTQRSFEFNVNTAALTNASLESAELILDFSGLSLLEQFTVYAMSGTYHFLGLLGTGPLSLNLGMFGDEIENGLLSIRIQTNALISESVRLDGANLHVQSASVPEPATLLLTGLGMTAAAVFHRRRRRAHVPSMVS